MVVYRAVFRKIVARLSGVEPVAVGLKALARTVRKRLDDRFRSSGFGLQEAGGRGWSHQHFRLAAHSHTWGTSGRHECSFASLASEKSERAHEMKPPKFG